MWGVQPPFERGRHAHKDTEQLVVSVAGSLDIDVSDVETTRTFHLDDPSQGLYIPAMIWIDLHNFTRETVCLVAASTHYDLSKVIRDRDEYCRLALAKERSEAM